MSSRPPPCGAVELAVRDPDPAQEAAEVVGAAREERHLRHVAFHVIAGEARDAVGHGGVRAVLRRDAEDVAPLPRLRDEGHVRARGDVREREVPLGVADCRREVVADRRVARVARVRPLPDRRELRHVARREDDHVVERVLPRRVEHGARDRRVAAAGAARVDVAPGAVHRLHGCATVAAAAEHAAPGAAAAAPPTRAAERSVVAADALLTALQAVRLAPPTTGGERGETDSAKGNGREERDGATRGMLDPREANGRRLVRPPAHPKPYSIRSGCARFEARIAHAVMARNVSKPPWVGHAALRRYRWCRPLTRGRATTFPSSLGSTSRLTGASPSRLMCGRSLL